jgi:Na+/H+ antiporter NhaA
VKLTKLFAEFFDSEQLSGIILVLCTIASLSIANSLLREGYLELWHTKIGIDVGSIHLNYSLNHWINDGLMVQKVFETIIAVAKEGVTMLLIEQNARLALEVSDRGYVMESGEITLEGPAPALLHDPKVRAAYLGEAA